jgi:hypothetical protein
MTEVIERTMSVTTVKDVIKARGTRICTVKFVKADGSLRVANGLFRPSSHIVGSEQGFRQSEQMKERGQIPFYDLQKKAWVSFYVDRVVDIR